MSLVEPYTDPLVSYTQHMVCSGAQVFMVRTSDLFLSHYGPRQRKEEAGLEPILESSVSIIILVFLPAVFNYTLFS